MKPNRLSRLIAAFITLFSLLFTQLAVASYTCPDLKTSPVQAAVSAMPEPMVGCPDMDDQQPGLCKAHCVASHQSLDTPGMPHVAPFVPTALAGVVPDLRLSASDLEPTTISEPLFRITAPPIAIRHCCFRI